MTRTVLARCSESPEKNLRLGSVWFVRNPQLKRTRLRCHKVRDSRLLLPLIAKLDNTTDSGQEPQEQTASHD